MADVFDPEAGYPGVVPYVRYRDPVAAIEWLSAVFDAHEGVRMTLPDGRVGHAELVVGGQVLSLGLSTAPAQPAPGNRHEIRAMTLVFVPDVHAATGRAVEGGGTLVDAATDQPWGLRQSVVADPEGHVWELTEFRRAVRPDEWGAQITGSWPAAIA